MGVSCVSSFTAGLSYFQTLASILSVSGHIELHLLEQQAEGGEREAAVRRQVGTQSPLWQMIQSHATINQ